MVPKKPQITMQITKILAVMLEDPTSEFYGLELADRAKLKSGTTYPALARLERFGWLTSTWEKVDPVAEGRPRRRLYTLTGEGEVAARQAVNDVLQQIAPASTRGAPWGLEPGGQPA